VSAGEVVHPAWCDVAECLTTATTEGPETVHASPDRVVGLSRVARALALGGRPRKVRAEVAVMRFDGPQLDGPPRVGEPVVVLDVPDSVVPMTVGEARRLAAAILAAVADVVGAGE
jgi:hypothetical protein